MLKGSPGGFEDPLGSEQRYALALKLEARREHVTRQDLTAPLNLSARKAKAARRTGASAMRTARFYVPSRPRHSAPEPYSKEERDRDCVAKSLGRSGRTGLRYRPLRPEQRARGDHSPTTPIAVELKRVSSLEVRVGVEHLGTPGSIAVGRR